MLIDRCPNLEFLIIGDEGPTMHSERTLSIKPLLQARWPNLRSLFLFQRQIQQSIRQRKSSGRPTTSFVHHRPSSESSPTQIPPHPNVGIYTESYDPRQISPLRLLSSSCGIPSEHFTSQLGLLRQVHLTDKSYRGEQEWSAVKRYLGSLSALEHLSIQLDFSAEIQDGSYKFDKNRKIVYKPVRHDQIGELQALRDIPTIFHRRQNVRSANSGKGLGRYLSLKHLEVWKVLKKSSSEDNLGMAAARIALDENPRTRGIGPFSESQACHLPVNLTHPSLETIVFVACKSHWGRPNQQEVALCQQFNPKTARLLAQPVQVVQRAAFGIRRLSEEDPARTLILNKSMANSLARTSRIPADTFSPVSVAVSRASSSPPPPPTTTITLSANERNSDSTLTQSYNWEFRLKYPPSTPISTGDIDIFSLGSSGRKLVIEQYHVTVYEAKGTRHVRSRS
ncbi:hypothetical protein D9757_014365 [Collybiopsis confluens]|uniref:Uncharacterized protein n=1 Tax=Collybiopsis confluens TaxID=2823264 RepID=A0A8H5FQL1_9AGAR|nr:hypothetical protein D9757_014365 [Collybiopsis confluens]